MSDYWPSQGDSTARSAYPLLRAVPVPCVVLYTDGRIHSCNPAVKEVFGWNENELVSAHPPFVPRSNEGKWRELIDRASQEGSVGPVDISLQRIRGQHVDASVTISRTPDERDVLLAVIEDRTRTVDLEKEVQLYSRVLRHNLRNELNVTLGYADMLSNRLEDPTHGSWAEQIRGDTRRILEYAETARRFDRVFDGSDDMTTVSLETLVEPLLESYRHQYPDVTITSKLSSATARAISSIDLAIENLVENAIEHNDSASPVVDVQTRTTVDRGVEWAEIVVADNGPGIPQHERRVLTEGSESALQHGNGLGLWLVYWLVRKSRGELLYDSNDPRGSIITLRLLTSD